MSYDPVVLTRLSTFMQRIADHVRLGYCFWTSGEINADKAPAFVRKFDRLYAVGRTRHQRAWARLKGEAGAVLLLYAPTAHTPPTTGKDEPTKVAQLPTSSAPKQTTATEPPTADTPCPITLLWVLLVTPGEHLAHRFEVLRDANTEIGRIQVRDFELVRLPRPGQASAAWTWRLTTAAYQGWRANLIDVARRQPARLPSEVQRLGKTPGFAGCRAQVKKLLQLAKAEHQRRMPGNAVLTVPRVWYVQRLASGTLRLSQLRRNSNRHTLNSTTGVG
ncbi:MAG: hypothetical protein E7K47_22295 [Acidovorax sp.]|jgi:hypothetical protein|nr:hypothetical protein [Acidovorax sp.]